MRASAHTYGRRAGVPRQGRARRGTTTAASVHPPRPNTGADVKHRERVGVGFPRIRGAWPHAKGARGHDVRAETLWWDDHSASASKTGPHGHLGLSCQSGKSVDGGEQARLGWQSNILTSNDVFGFCFLGFWQTRFSRKGSCSAFALHVAMAGPVEIALVVCICGFYAYLALLHGFGDRRD